MIHCVYRDPLSHTAIERKKRAVFSIEQFYEHIAVALSAILFSRVLWSNDGAGHLLLVSHNVTRSVSVHYSIHALNCTSTWNAAMSWLLTNGRV